MDQDRHGRHGGDSLFKYSLIPLLVVCLFLLAVFFPILIGTVFFTPNLVAGLFYFVLDFLLAGSALRFYSYDVHQASFFDDYFIVRGRGPRRKFRYEQVAKVEKVTVAPILTNRTQVRINLLDEAPILIPGNLRNRKLKADLYSWLSGRVQRRAP